MYRTNGKENMEELDEILRKISDLEEDIESLYDFLTDNGEIKNQWLYLADRRFNSAQEIKKNFENLKGSLWYVKNTCGVILNIHEGD